MAEKRKSTRRQFLQGRAAIDALEGICDGPNVSDDAPPPAANRSGTSCEEDTYLLQIERRAMACQFVVYLNAGRRSEAAEAAVESLDLVDALEDQMSVYRDHSEISQINQQAGLRPVPVEPRLFDLLAHAVELYHETDGAFDMTAGPLTKVWGFYRRQGQLPEESELRQALERVGSRWLALDAGDRTIRFERAGIELNLGGIGKGHALDRAAESLTGGNVESFLLHGGQSSVLARGTRARGPTDQAGWTVGIRHPLRPDRRLGEVRLHDCALGTSGTGTQFFHHRGKRYGHILDPRTGWPAEGMLSSTAITSCAATADALSTAFYVMGVDHTSEFCEQHPEVAAILVCRARKSGAVDVHAFNLDDQRWRYFD